MVDLKGLKFSKMHGIGNDFPIIDESKGEVIPEADKPDFIRTGDAAIVQIKPTKPMVMEEAKNIPPMGRFAIRDMGQTVAAGLCLKVTPAK